MKTGLKKSTEGYPYKPARFIEAKWRWHVEYGIYDVQKEKIVRKVYSKIPGRTDAERRRNGKKIAIEINELLVKGYIIDKSEPVAEVPKIVTLEAAMTKAVKVKISSGSRATQVGYRSFLNVFMEWAREVGLEKMNITSFQRGHVLQFIDWLHDERECGNVTRNNYINKIKACFSELRQRNIVEKNPVSGVEKLPEKMGNAVAFTEDQRAQLESWLKKHDYRLYLFTRFMYYGYMRPVEICRMQVKHIDVKNRVILVRSYVAKNKRQQPIYIPTGLLKVIEEMKIHKLSPETYPFSTNLEPGDREIYRNRVSERHLEALKESGVYNGELIAYSWKHSGVCNAYRAGVDIRSIQSQCRHSNLEMTERYLRSMGLRLDDKLEGIDW